MAADCPECGAAGQVTRGARGSASCATCGGGFVALPVAFAAFQRAGMDALRLQAALSREGRQVKPCVTCDTLFASFPVFDEIVHVCVPCAAVWLAAPVLARLNAVAETGTHNAAPQNDEERASFAALAELEPALPPAAQAVAPSDDDGGPASMTASAATPDMRVRAGHIEPSDTNDEHEILILLDDTPEAINERPPEVRVPGTFKNLATLALVAPMAKPASASSTLVGQPTLAPQLRSGPERAGREREPTKGKDFPLRKLGAVLAILGGLGFGVSQISGPQEGEPLGGGRSAAFWNAPVEVTPVVLGGRTATRLSSKKDDKELLALFVPGGGLPADGSGGKIVLIQLLGDEVALLEPPKTVDGLAVLSASVTWRGAPTRTGRARAYFSENDAWILIAVAPDGGDFAQSSAAEAYMSSLAAVR